MTTNPAHTDPPDAASLLRGAGLRITPVRRAVLEALAGSPAALDAQDLLAALRGRFDRVTVYRTLASLVDAGIAHKVDPGDRRFRFGLTSHHRCTGDHHVHEHPHLLCDSCGKVECMDDAEVVIRPVAHGRRTGHDRARRWRVKQQSVTVHGTCAECDTRRPAGARSRRA